MNNKYLSYLGAIIVPLISQNLIAQSENSFSFINDSTIARYRFEEHQQTFAEVPSGKTIDDIDLLERELLKPLNSKIIITEGVNSSFEPYFEIKNLEEESFEDWIKTPYLQLLAPNGNYGFDSTGVQQYYYPNNAVVKNDNIELQQLYTSEGFQPIMLFFPNIRDPFVRDAQDAGAILYNLPNNAFKLKNGPNELLISPQNKQISSTVIIDSIWIETITAYTLYAPYGYVPIWEEVRKKRLDLSNPITLVEQRTFSNHVIEDINGIIEKYTDHAHLEVYPNPIQEEYSILLRGIPDAQIAKVQVRDHMGNILQTHLNPTVNQDIINLNAASYPSGILILLVHTQHGLYSVTITKI
tara:strand:+ start:736 stop:1800 length:1065 start_codon:yes stop_codon:yes gene_type:complete